MRVIAQRGGPDMLLVETRESSEGLMLGRIFNVPRREMGREMPVAAIAKWGYWDDYVGSQDVLRDLTDVRYVEGGR